MDENHAMSQLMQRTDNIYSDRPNSDKLHLSTHVTQLPKIDHIISDSSVSLY